MLEYRGLLISHGVIKQSSKCQWRTWSRGVQPYSITKLLGSVVFVFKLVSSAATSVQCYCNVNVVQAVNWHMNGATGTRYDTVHVCSTVLVLLVAHVKIWRCHFFRLQAPPPKVDNAEPHRRLLSDACTTSRIRNLIALPKSF